MSQPVRAIYQDGQLHLLDSVDLVDGQEIQLLILSKNEPIQAALGDLLVQDSISEDEAIDEEALMRLIEEDFQGQAPLSDTIIQERNESL